MVFTICDVGVELGARKSSSLCQSIGNIKKGRKITGMSDSEREKEIPKKTFFFVALKKKICQK